MRQHRPLLSSKAAQPIPRRPPETAKESGPRPDTSPMTRPCSKVAQVKREGRTDPPLRLKSPEATLTTGNLASRLERYPGRLEPILKGRCLLLVQIHEFVILHSFHRCHLRNMHPMKQRTKHVIQSATARQLGNPDRFSQTQTVCNPHRNMFPLPSSLNRYGVFTPYLRFSNNSLQ